MNQQLKQRLVGTTVLVILAVIFLPMILKRPETTQNKPQVRDFEVVPYQEKKKQTAIPQEVFSRHEDIQKNKPTNSQQNQQKSKGTAVVNTEKVPTSQPAENGNQSPAPNQTSKKMAAAEPGSNNTAGWAIQLGSFTNRENAARLVSRLTDRQYKAYLETVPSENKVIFRVRVGPIVSKEEAQQVGKKIELQENLKPLIVTLQ